MKNKKAFTLVELLAVIIVLAIILVIAVPQVLDVVNSSKVNSLKVAAIQIANEAEREYADRYIEGATLTTIQCSEITELNNEDYGTCTVKYDEDGVATVKLKGKKDGKFNNLKCEGTRNNMTCGDIPPLPVINCSFTPSEEDIIETAKVYIVKDYDACMTFLKSIFPEEELTDEILNQVDSVCKGNGIPEYGKSTSEIFEGMISGSTEGEQELIDLNVINVEEIDVYEYVNGQYTYRYGQEYGRDDWHTTGINGWGVTLTDKESTEDITSEVCTYINDKPIVSMSGMFANSNATLVDLSSFNTSNVTNMSGMFYGTGIVTKLYDDGLSFNENKFNLVNINNSPNNYKIMPLSTLLITNGILNLSNFDTSNVTDMSGMFSDIRVVNLDLSSFNTGNVTNMSSMFYNSKVTSIDLSSFNTSNVTSVDGMFCDATFIDTIDISHFDLSKASDAGSILSCSR